MSNANRRSRTTSYSTLQNISWSYQAGFSTQITASSPVSLYIYRMQQVLKKHEASFGNTPRQRKMRTKFNNRFKLSMNYPLETLQRCLLQAC